MRILTSFRPGPGSFAKIKYQNGFFVAGNWQSCREVWHRIGRREKFFLYSHEISKGKTISNFITALEKRLGLRKFTVIGPTQRKTISWIKPASWWISGAMRNSFFTIALRAGYNYKGNFEEALFEHIYFRETRYAVERFLNGYNRYSGKMSGWYHQFYLCPDEKVDGLLLKS